MSISWRKSSLSNDKASCVEIAEQPATALVRDSKDPDGPRLAFDRDAWSEFVAAVKHDDRLGA